MPRLRIEGLERDLEVETGQDVRQVCRKNHVSVFWSLAARLFNCRGIGLCGACPIRVLESGGSLPQPTKQEARRLEGKPKDWRLACQLKVRSDLRIELYPMLSVEERVGAEAVHRARLDEAEREELVKRERRERVEARRAEVKEFLSARKKRRSKIVGFFTKRIKRGEKGEKGTGKDKRESKQKGLAGRLKRDGKGKGKEKKPAGERGGPEEKAGRGGEKRQPFKLGKREKKGKKGRKKEVPAESSARKGGE